jgi:pimeloyl-ACP methyl ester carboxylesterase
MSTKRKWLLFGGLSLVVAAVILVVGISLYVGWQLTHPAKKPLDESPEDYGLAYESFVTKSRLDQINLSGWIIETNTQSEGVIVFAHGYRGNRLEEPVPALALARDLVEEGYHVIMFDFRNSGESDGEKTTVGFEEKHDLMTVVQWAKSRYPDLPLGVIGFSMGAATAIEAAEEEPLIEAVVADSPFRDLKDYLSENLSFWSGLPNFPFTPVILGILPLLLDVDLSQVSPENAIKSLGIPVLLIHGTGDEAIPYSNSEAIYANGNPDQVQLWVTEEAGHVRTYNLYPEEYLSKVVQFLETAFNDE